MGSDRRPLALCASDQAGGVYGTRSGHHLGPGAQPLGSGLWPLHRVRGRQNPSQPLQPLPPAPGFWVRRAPQGTSLGRGGAQGAGTESGSSGDVPEQLPPQGPGTQHQMASPLPRPHAHAKSLGLASPTARPSPHPHCPHHCLTSPLSVPASPSLSGPLPCQDSGLPPSLPSRTPACLALQGIRDGAQTRLPPPTPPTLHLHACRPTYACMNNTLTGVCSRTRTRSHMHIDVLAYTRDHTCGDRHAPDMPTLTYTRTCSQTPTCWSTVAPPHTDMLTHARTDRHILADALIHPCAHTCAHTPATRVHAAPAISPRSPCSHFGVDGFPSASLWTSSPVTGLGQSCHWKRCNLT